MDLETTSKGLFAAALAGTSPRVLRKAPSVHEATTVTVPNPTMPLPSGSTPPQGSDTTKGSLSRLLRLLSSLRIIQVIPFRSFHWMTSKIEMPLDLIKRASVTYQHTLYGYFLGPRLYFPHVVKEVKRHWAKLGSYDERKWFSVFFRFNSVDGLRQVLEGGPWMIRGIPLFVFAWDPLQGLVKPEHKSCPFWVNLGIIFLWWPLIGKVSDA
ncbi:LOW QUALITY PROTEIN: hypothetical protein OSB04_un001658 [Centaurea solstitialis]|uniref:DUF4283 domain-containing protein n=1 Tax=Centaurea solstitialis TaxID=347529 RepID=A0AA38SNC8_9ASTR|nr:LOW QUALITY PROTEIN: hypothetical protein OSB04_un001658 [Centaurea solstitialis]